ncbi:MAG TPA: hypothetical protein VLH77_03945 [Gammaproteobacteria bacterium]|nr:hypothetical protein [Gammaproteobacteria bacterium]
MRSTGPGSIVNNSAGGMSTAPAAADAEADPAEEPGLPPALTSGSSLLVVSVNKTPSLLLTSLVFNITNSPSLNYFF